MSLLCDIYGSSYKYKRNLTRHIKEKHCDVEHWNCVIGGCSAKFIRRSYLSKHLILHHSYDKVTARECAMNAYRGDYQEQSYYENVSDDDSILDLIVETDGTVYDQQYNDILIQFNVNKLEGHKSNYDINVLDRACDVEMEMDDRQNSDGAISTKPVRARYEVNQWLSDISDVEHGDVHDKNDADSDGDKGIRCNSGNNLSENSGNCGEIELSYDSELDYISLYSDVHDGLSGDDSMAHDNNDDNLAHGNSDDYLADGNSDDNLAHGNSDDNVAHGLDNYENDPDDIIIISSDEESTAIELSNMKTKIQTFTYTVTRTIKYVTGN